MFPYKLYIFDTSQVDSVYLIYIISIFFYKLQEKYKYYFFYIFKSDKRQIPTLLRKVLAVDAYLTNEIVKLVEKIVPLRQLKVHYKLLEV